MHLAAVVGAVGLTRGLEERGDALDLLVADAVGGHGDAERVDAQVPAAVDVQGPAGGAVPAGEHDGQRLSLRAGQADQPVLELLGRRARRPRPAATGASYDDPAGRSAHRHGPPRATARARRPRRRGRSTIRMRSSPMPARPVGQPGGGDAHVRRPGGSTALQRDRRRDLARHVGVAVDGDHTTGRLEVDQDVAALAVDAEADQGGVRDRLVRRARRSPRTGRAPRSRRRPRCATPRPGRRTAGASMEGDGVVVQPHGVHRAAAEPTPRGRPPSGHAARGRGTPRATAWPPHGARPRPRRHREAAPIRRRRSKARAASAVAASRPVPSRPPGHLLHTLLGDGGGSLVARTDCSSGLAQGWRPAAAVIRCTPTASSGTTRFQPGLDQPGQLELASVGLHEALVQLVDLPVAAAVAQQPLGDVPEVVVVAVLRCRHRVDLVPDQVLLRGDLVRSPPLGPRLVGVGAAWSRRPVRRLAAATSAPGCSAVAIAEAAGPEITSASSSAPTRARASFWTGPPSGTGWASPPRRAAATSTATQTTKNSHASQTTNSSTLSSVVKVSWPVSVSLVGSDVGNGSRPGEQPEQHRHPDDETEQRERGQRAAAAARRRGPARPGAGSARDRGSSRCSWRFS